MKRVRAGPLRRLHRLLLRQPSPPESEKARTGREGEEAAARFLKTRKGVRILETNWRDGHGEIDLIARDGRVLVFIEVRSRHRDALVGGYASVTREKKRVLRRTALAYLRACKPRPAHFRFDVIEIRHSSAEPEIIHHENVRLFTKHD